jgi:hypothetical protein
VIEGGADRVSFFFFRRKQVGAITMEEKNREDISEPETESEAETDFLTHLRTIITEKFANIIEAIAQKSAEGSLPHTKYLFDIGGVKEGLRNQVQNNGEPSIAELLLGEVNKHQAALQLATIETVETHSETTSKPCADSGLPFSNCGAKGQ